MSGFHRPIHTGGGEVAVARVNLDEGPVASHAVVLQDRLKPVFRHQMAGIVLRSAEVGIGGGDSARDATLTLGLYPDVEDERRACVEFRRERRGIDEGAADLGRRGGKAEGYIGTGQAKTGVNCSYTSFSALL